MNFFTIVFGSFVLLTGCSHVAEKEVFKSALQKKSFESELEYLEAFSLRDFDNSRDHSIHAYPLTSAYLSSFTDFLSDHPKIREFVQTPSVIGRCFSLKIEARDLGRNEVDLVKWEVELVFKDQTIPMSFVRIPEVSPRRSVKHRITQRGRETWWINETFVCSDEALDLDQDFTLIVKRLDVQNADPYMMNWYIL